MRDRGLRHVPLLATFMSVTLCAALFAAARGPVEPAYTPVASHTSQTATAAPSPSASPTGSSTTAPAPTASPTGAPRALQPADACPPLLDWIREEAEPLVTPYGLQGMHGGGPTMVGPMPDRRQAEAGDAAAGNDGGASGGGGAEADRSGTNVQEAGIDEPDIVKQDDNLLVAVSGGRLHVVDIDAQPANLLATVDLGEGWDHQLLLRDKRLLVAATVHDVRIFSDQPADQRQGIVPGPVSPPTTNLTVYDLSAPASPKVINRLKVEGSLVSAREHNGLVRAVVHSWAAPDFVMPTSPEYEDKAKARNLEIVRTAPVIDWLPKVSIQSPDGPWNHRTVAPCGGVLHPRDTQDLSSVSVLTLSLADPSNLMGTATVAGAGETVYATTDNVYVAQGPLWTPDGEAMTPTVIHRFDTRDARAPRYASTATVRGRLLNQWAMSERAGHLRVATTTEPLFRDDGTTATQSESSLHVFRVADGAMPEVGKVEGLGKDERIYAVRYLDDVAYVVTFRQVDPLYVIDLSDPANPRVVGELKIPGFSAYLHPIGGGYLIGIGQDADADGRVTGFKASVFDVRNPAAPAQVGEWTMGPNSGSEAQYDHHAFLWWGPTRRLVLPVEQWREDGPGFIGSVSLAIGADGAITEAGRVQPRDHGAPEYTPVRRALMRGQTLLLVSEHGLLFADPASMRARDWLGFPQPPRSEEPKPMPIEDGPA